MAELDDVLLDRRFVGSVHVLVRVDEFRGGLMVGIAYQQFTVGLAADVLQSGEIRQHGHFGGGDALVHQHQLGPLRLHVQVDSDTGGEGGCPRSVGEDDVVGVDLRSVGHGHAVHRAVVIGQQFGDQRPPLADGDAHLACRRGEGHARHVRLAASTERLVGKEGEVFEMQPPRPQVGHGVVVDEVGGDAQSLHHRDGGLEGGLDVVLSDADHVAALAK